MTSASTRKTMRLACGTLCVLTLSVCSIYFAVSFPSSSVDAHGHHAIDTLAAPSNDYETASSDSVTSHGYNYDNTLVLFSGPTSMNRTQGKNELYLRNLDFFLNHGVNCQHQDTVITLTNQVYQVYQQRLQDMDAACGIHNHRVFYLIREPDCYDMESFRVLLYESWITTTTNIRVFDYDYFVFINCGMSGPAPTPRPWTYSFLEKLSPQIKMSGLSVNCFSYKKPHVMSFAYALDRVGLSIINQSGVVFDCRKRNYSEARTERQHRKLVFGEVVRLYEQGMGKQLLTRGFGLASIIPEWEVSVFWDWENRTACNTTDQWTEQGLRQSFGGQLPTMDQVLFFKSSRFLPEHIAELIKYPREPHWRSP